MAFSLRPAAPHADTMSGLPYPDLLRRALMFSHDLLRERDPERLQARVLRDSLELLGASTARLYLPSADGDWRLTLVTPPHLNLPAEAAEMEAELLPRALAAGKSLISTHPLLDPELSALAERCSARQITTHVILIRAYRQSYGAVGVHWLGKRRPVDFDGRSVFLSYWDNVGIAIATALERERVEDELDRLRRSAFSDRLTGLPNDQALQRELDAHAETRPLSALVLDFDGLRAANSAFGNREGGDVLIAAVGTELARLREPGEFAARMYTAGDEFAMLLPGRDEDAAALRRAEVEAALDALAVPERLATIYRGASVGSATRRPGETAGQVLGRAIIAMRACKAERSGLREPRR